MWPHIYGVSDNLCLASSTGTKSIDSVPGSKLTSKPPIYALFDQSVAEYFGGFCSFFFVISVGKGHAWITTTPRDDPRMSVSYVFAIASENVGGCGAKLINVGAA